MFGLVSIQLPLPPRPLVRNLKTRKHKTLIVQITTERAMAPAVSRRLLTAEAWVRTQASPREICGGQSGTGTGFCPEYFGFYRVSVIPPKQTLINLSVSDAIQS